MGFRRCVDCGSGGGHCGRRSAWGCTYVSASCRHHRRSSRCEFDLASIGVCAHPMGAYSCSVHRNTCCHQCRTDSRALHRKFAYRKNGGSGPGPSARGTLERCQRAPSGFHNKAGRRIWRVPTSHRKCRCRIARHEYTYHAVSDSSCVGRPLVGCSTSGDGRLVARRPSPACHPRYPVLAARKGGRPNGRSDIGVVRRKGVAL